MAKVRSKNFRRNWLAIFCGSFGAQTMYLLMYNYSMIFFTDFLGIGAGVAGTIFALSRVWDAINDPMCGVLVDKNNSRFGKTQPFVFIGGIVTAAASIALFTVPDLSVTGRTIWGTVAYNAVGMAFTAVTIAMLVQMPRASRDSKERVKFSVANTLASSIAGIVGAMGLTKGLAIFGSKEPARGYLVVAVLCSVIGVALVSANAFLFRDQASEEKKEEKKEKVITMVKAVLRTPPFLILVGAIILPMMGAGMTISSLIYYTTYVLKDPTVMQILLPLLYVATFTSCLTSSYLSRFGKVRVLKCAMVVSAAGFVVRIITGDSNLVVTVICYLVTNVAYGYLAVFLAPTLMDCADYAEYKTGVKCEALTLSGFTLCSKMGQGIGAALLGFALGVAGYDGTAAVQTDSATQMISMVHLYPMMIMMVLGALLLCFYKLDEKTMEKVHEAIDQD